MSLSKQWTRIFGVLFGVQSFADSSVGAAFVLVAFLAFLPNLTIEMLTGKIWQATCDCPHESGPPFQTFSPEHPFLILWIHIGFSIAWVTLTIIVFHLQREIGLRRPEVGGIPSSLSRMPRSGSSSRSTSTNTDSYFVINETREFLYTSHDLYFFLSVLCLISSGWVLIIFSGTTGYAAWLAIISSLQMVCAGLSVLKMQDLRRDWPAIIDRSQYETCVERYKSLMLFGTIAFCDPGLLQLILRSRIFIMQILYGLGRDGDTYEEFKALERNDFSQYLVITLGQLTVWCFVITFSIYMEFWHRSKYVTVGESTKSLASGRGNFSSMGNPGGRTGNVTNSNDNGLTFLDILSSGLESGISVFVCDIVRYLLRPRVILVLNLVSYSWWFLMSVVFQLVVYDPNFFKFDTAFGPLPDWTKAYIIFLLCLWIFVVGFTIYSTVTKTTVFVDYKRGRGRGEGGSRKSDVKSSAIGDSDSSTSPNSKLQSLLLGNESDGAISSNPVPVSDIAFIVVAFLCMFPIGIGFFLS